MSRLYGWLEFTIFHNERYLTGWLAIDMLDTYKQDPQKIKDYLSQIYPEAVAEAKKHKTRLNFSDETAFRSDSHRGATWGKIGETPIVRDSGGRFGFKLISAVSARGDMHFDFIADNARYHHSKKVQAFLKNTKWKHYDGFFPAYSPELNPDEQVWNHAKADVGKRTIQSKEVMEKVILSAMLAIQNKIELVKSFFLLPDTLHANSPLA